MVKRPAGEHGGADRPDDGGADEGRGAASPFTHYLKVAT